ncbi:hypothetical protein [Lactiplantibacillus argentoratensis]|uniref:hypothetical protein n=1 Tax=Lactiplantibacillus argentoratensis TaxID=271881 RepID=UPI001B335A3D|nr:hypothetical protein [Lactiplantibacillus argentoratensis]MBP5809470.1 hypothetical protein [Lactiplantibacillus argentoratensis]
MKLFIQKIVDVFRRSGFILKKISVEIVGWWNTLSDLDREHVVALGYLYSIVFPVSLSLLTLIIIKNNPVRVINWSIIFLTVIITGVFSCLIIGRLVFDVKKLRFMVVVSEFITVLISLLYSLSWLYLAITLLLHLFIPNLAMNPFKLLIETNDSWENVSSSVTSLSFLIGGSFLLNLFLPQSLNAVKINLKLRVRRFFLKIGYIALFIAILFILLKIDKNNFIVVATCYTAIMWWGSPEKLLPVFTDITGSEVDEISDVVKQRFLMGKWVVTQIFISWLISVYLFSKDKYIQVIEFEILTVTMIVLTVVAKMLILSRKDLFTSWFKNQVKSDKDK